ncbi:hypothetical protein [Sinomicrobium weinanense]|uniref:Uncharacterized protein n=1 Tax=Sinomicrobium weinanense TaxID=2842200 RepID=A0A926Q3K3_9FLAO|nr:hypothetical protein [Sinomicrobium weinanense]MBC9795865.1 hypothetical protein [Sinomicrobium weinanense]MBU3125385.1 hypothetical protein [Sinomicrobium weinanense]
MKISGQKLQQLQQQWSAEMTTFHELQQTHKTLNEELRECLQKLDALALRQGSGTTSPVRLGGQNV